jgi:thiol:disulfide interchange protein DsbD
MNSKKLLYLFVFLSGFIFSNIPFEDNDLLNVDEAFIFNVEVKKNKIIASWEIKPGYYLYKKSISIQNSNNIIKHNFISKNELRVFDEFFGESVIFKDYLSIVAEIVDNEFSEFNDIKVAYQGCAEGRYCYPKMIKSL